MNRNHYSNALMIACYFLCI